MGKVRSIVRILNFRKANFQLFKELVNRTPWEVILGDRGGEQNWQIFKDTFHTVQELSIPRCKKSGKESKRTALLSQDLQVKLQGNKEIQRQWKLGQVSCEQYRNAAWLCRDGVKRAKEWTELNLSSVAKKPLAKDAKNNKRGFYMYVSQKRKV